MSKLEVIADGLRTRMESANTARELALKDCRETIKLASRTIRSIHRQEWQNASELLAETRQMVDAVKFLLADFPGLYWAGYVHDSQKEYVEASVVLSMACGESIPHIDSLGVEPGAYLNGLAEAGSECRRYVLDRLRADEVDEADRVMAAMDEIYFELVTFDFPDAITGGLRRTTDSFRAVLERTRSDLMLTTRQRQLQVALESMLQVYRNND